ncbi:MAG: glycosyltransferase [Rhodobacteraceae bacterium]|jgi:glycosyltransferase involved in cell wall biosynthesis|nr:glycosyltransferase [Paracoccaceae bacterium]
MTRATILIPAHNEAAVIGRTLWYMSRGLDLGAMQVIVIANGCDDATAARARAALPQAQVIETATPGKCHALNLGYRSAMPDAPVICLDADLDVTAEALAELLAPIAAGRAQAACGQMDVDTSAVGGMVRAFYRGWRAHPYFTNGKFGGLFALSAEAAAQVFPLPEITADDEYIRRSFDAGDIAFVPGCRFLARAPRTLSSLVRVRRRSLRGAREVTRMGKATPDRGRTRAMLSHALRVPADAIPVAVFLMVSAWVRLSLLTMRAAPRWERDLTTRPEL